MTEKISDAVASSPEPSVGESKLASGVINTWHLVFFVVAAFGCLIVDRDQVRERMHIALLEGRITDTPWGPRLGVRWWRFGAGVLLGLACATKWSGLYFVAFFGLLTLAFDIAARRQ